MDRKPQIVTCETLSLGIGTVAGLLMLGLLRHDFGWAWIWALLGGVIVGGAVTLALRWALCRGGSLLDGHEAVPEPPAVRKTAPATGARAAPTPAQAPTPATPGPAPTPAQAPAADVPAAPPARDPAKAPSTTSGAAAAGGRPAGLAAARGGRADDLKKIKGVGPKLEQALHGMGIYHFDQIAAWTEAEIAWVDENLQGFRGRATRDEWVAQAKLLAAGGETEFSARVDRGKVT